MLLYTTRTRDHARPGLGPVRGEDSVLALTFPMGTSRLPGIAAEDIGKPAYGIFSRGDELIGETISIAGEHLTGAQLAEKMGRALGEGVRVTTTSTRMSSAASASRARTRSGTCSSSSAASRPSTPACATSITRGRSTRSSRTSIAGSRGTPNGSP